MPINEWRPGRDLFTCQKCGKQIWLQRDLWDKASYKYGLCLDCGQRKGGDDNASTKQNGR